MLHQLARFQYSPKAPSTIYHLQRLSVRLIHIDKRTSWLHARDQLNRGVASLFIFSITIALPK